jgi:rRNA maturation protein Nop10
MTTRDRAYARATGQQMAPYTELWIIGMPEDIATLMHAASRSGQLAYASAPQRVSPDDPRMRRYLRLRIRTHR